MSVLPKHKHKVYVCPFCGVETRCRCIGPHEKVFQRCRACQHKIDSGQMLQDCLGNDLNHCGWKVQWPALWCEDCWEDYLSDPDAYK